MTDRTDHGEHCPKRKSKQVNAMAFSPDGVLLATGSSEKTVQLWEPMTGTCRAILKGHSKMVSAVVFVLS